MGILRPEFPDLPKDAQTLLGTQTKVPKVNICNGEYYHFGLVKGLQNILSRISSIPKTLAVQFNIDGIPLFKSSRTQFWPILATVYCDQSRIPFLVGLFSGNSKPSSVWEYLREFIAELKVVLHCKEWNSFQSCRLLIYLWCSCTCTIPDAPPHNGYYGCGKCSQPGVWANKRTYPETGYLDYEMMINEEHNLNNSLSPLSGLVKMVTQFPVDYMHTCCLGVTRRLIQMWMKGR